MKYQNNDLDYPQELITWFTLLVKYATTPMITNPSDYLRVYPNQDSFYLDEVQTILVFPVTPEMDTLSGLVVMFTERREFSEKELDLVNTFADQASLAIANAHLRDQAEEIAIITERNRLARDLHDAVTQTLFSASLIVEAIPDIWIADREEGVILLIELQHLNRGALAEMRALLMELRPITLEESKLADLFVHLGEVVAGRADIDVHLDINNNVYLPTEVRISLYRIAQEALTNVVKHAQASQATLRLHSQRIQNVADQENSFVQILLEIQDDGIGFDPDSVPPDRFGMTNIRERAVSIGARVKIISQSGKGTQILVSWEGEEETHG